MKISTKGRYALRMLLDLAEHREDGYIPLKVIAERQDISKQYLEQIITLFHATNILRANRGKHGGYMLGVEPSSCTVGQVLRVTEGSLVPVSCLEDDINQCERSSTCKTLPMWTEFCTVISNYLDSITLQDMLEHYRENGANSYVI